MKAQTFLEYFNECSHSEELGFIEAFQSCEKYYNFISQPFVPEMIVELFEGWKFQQYTHDYYLDAQRFGIDFDFEDRIAYFKGNLCYRTKSPQTINDFISDCQRAGIELTFKEEIAKQF